MSYTHSGEIGDVWKHLPLCEILKIEVPLTYHETNSAYASYTISANHGIVPPNTPYALEAWHKSVHIRIDIMNSIIQTICPSYDQS